MVSGPATGGALFEEGRVAAGRLFAAGPMPDGVFAYNDLWAAAVLAEAKRRGLRVPQDLAVVGCDDTAICGFTDPPLSSIDTARHEAAALAVRQLIALAEGRPAEPRHATVAPKLVPRESTAQGGAA
jgi:DNA-binding LacI/PurR family transcriptional regulator